MGTCAIGLCSKLWTCLCPNWQCPNNQFPGPLEKQLAGLLPPLAVAHLCSSICLLYCVLPEHAMQDWQNACAPSAAHMPGEPEGGVVMGVLSLKDLLVSWSAGQCPEVIDHLSTVSHVNREQQTCLPACAGPASGTRCCCGTLWEPPTSRVPTCPANIRGSSLRCARHATHALA